MDNGGDHRGATDCSRPATQGRHVVDNSTSSTGGRATDAAVLRRRRVSTVDGPRGATRRQIAVLHTREQGVGVLAVADRRGSRHDARSAALPPHRLHHHHYHLSGTS